MMSNHELQKYRIVKVIMSNELQILYSKRGNEYNENLQMSYRKGHEEYRVKNIVS